MDDVWFGQGATPTDYETCVRALSIAPDRSSLLAIATGEPAPRLLFASHTFFNLLGADTAGALERRLLGGDEPAARRLRTVIGDLQLGSAARLERLRFLTEPGTEILTFLCRRISTSNRDVFVAAIPNTLTDPGHRQAYAGAPASASTPSPVRALEPREHLPRGEAQTNVAVPMNVQAIQAALRSRWPASRTLRFTWQTDADLICTQITPALAEIVGEANADLVGHDMVKLAAVIDPSGRFERALASKATWSGLKVHWPIADASAAVAVGLGAIPIFEREGGFEGFRGYGVVDRETAIAFPPVRLALPPEDKERREKSGANLLSFPGSQKELSAEDQETFVALGEELREEAGLDETEAEDSNSGAVQQTKAEEQKHQDLASYGFAICNKLAIGILVARDNVPIFANRHLLDRLGFRDEDELHEAGGLDHLFNGQPNRSLDGEMVGVRDHDGEIVPSQARIQTIEWDGLPATLLTMWSAPEGPAKPKGREDTELHELRAILETATDGVAVIDKGYNVLSLNRSGEALFGCDRSQVIGRPFLSLFAADNQNLVRNYLEGLSSNATKQLLNDGREFIVNIHPRGAIPVFMTLGCLPARDPSLAGDGPRFCALFRDLTHWKKVEKDLESAKLNAESANDRKSDFLAKISHEIRTPLNAIIGFAEVMMDERLGPVGSDRYKDYLRDIHASGTHVMSLVNDLLDLSKIEAGKMELAVEVIDVNKVIGECVAIMQPQASSSRVILRLSLSSTLPRIKADERSLRQIVLNILSNAVKFNDPGGQVIVATALTDSGHAVIRIRDTGPGMSDLDISAALEPFRQLPTARPNAGGTGLGLPLTKALVEANQATFTIRSKVQQGTLVEVAFPPARILAA